MGKKSYLKQIISLEMRITEHIGKIEIEKKKSVPNAKLIIYWEKEIDKFRDEISKSKKRLERG